MVTYVFKNSTNLKSMEFDNNGNLFMTFQGEEKYHYEIVDSVDINELIRQDELKGKYPNQNYSPGRYFNKKIKANTFIKYTKLT